MDRRLKLKDNEIFLFRTRVFEDSRDSLSRLYSRAVSPAAYACTSNLIMEKEQSDMAGLSSFDMDELIKDICLACSSEALTGKKVVFSDKDFRLDYSAERGHGEPYDVSEFGASYSDLKNFRSRWVANFGKENMPDLILR